MGRIKFSRNMYPTLFYQASIARRIKDTGMHCWKVLIVTGLLVQATGCTSSSADWPPFVDNLIAQLRGSEKRNPPASIQRYTYNGVEVYYVPPYCCDVPGELYNRDGSFICAPDGGITGQGDGKCPDFFRERSNEELVWADPRK